MPPSPYRAMAWSAQYVSGLVACFRQALQPVKSALSTLQLTLAGVSGSLGYILVTCWNWAQRRTFLCASNYHRIICWTYSSGMFYIPLHELPPEKEDSRPYVLLLHCDQEDRYHTRGILHPPWMCLSTIQPISSAFLQNRHRRISMKRVTTKRFVIIFARWGRRSPWSGAWGSLSSMSSTAAPNMMLRSSPQPSAEPLRESGNSPPCH